jgi:hypothetical protein
MRQLLVNVLYGLVCQLRTKEINDGRYSFLAYPVPEEYIQCGLYFFFDPNHEGDDGTLRIVRIGITGDNDNNRLRLHQNGPNHMSLFRRHVTRALTHINGAGFDRAQVSAYIHGLPYLFLPIGNLPNLQLIERRCIEIVSNRHQQVAIDAPHPDWIGYANGPGINVAVSTSHLWNVHHTSKFNPGLNDYNMALELLEHHINLQA